MNKQSTMDHISKILALLRDEKRMNHSSIRILRILNDKHWNIKRFIKVELSQYLTLCKDNKNS